MHPLTGLILGTATAGATSWWSERGDVVAILLFGTVLLAIIEYLFDKRLTAHTRIVSEQVSGAIAEMKKTLKEEREAFLLHGQSLDLQWNSARESLRMVNSRVDRLAERVRALDKVEEPRIELPSLASRG